MRPAAAAALAGLMLLGIGTASAVAGSRPPASDRPVLLQSSGGTDQPNASTPSPAPSPQDDPIGAETCTEDRSEAAEPQEAAEEANEVEDCPGENVAGGDRHRRGPDLQVQRGRPGDDGRRSDDGGADASESRG